jgi:hypothetical protein
MATKPVYYIETFDTGVRPHPWRLELRRHSEPMGVSIGAGGYQSRVAADYAGKQALQRFLEELKEKRRKWAETALRRSIYF